MARKKILIIDNLQVNGNPALIRIAHDLNTDFDVTVFGGEKNFQCNDANIKYKSFFFTWFITRLLRRLARLCGVFSKNIQNFFLVFSINLYNYIQSLYIPDSLDLLIFIDAEAAGVLKYKKISCPKFYFIYELFANQTLDSSFNHSMYDFECLGVRNAQVLMSSANEELGNFLVRYYQLEPFKILAYSICPPKALQFSPEYQSEDPLKFYYHGGLQKNRGIENAILAFKHLDGAHLYIRGKGPILASLKKLVHANCLEDKVFFLDYLPTAQLTEAASSFDIGLSLVRMNTVNHQYNVGFKTFENISAGLALILPKSDPLKILNQEHGVGLLYEDATVEELKQVFNQFIANPKLVNQCKENSRRAYSLTFNPEYQKEHLIKEIHKYL